MLAELMRLRYGIAIAGAHGKTTTTSMVALVLERAGLDPTAVIGGRLSAFGSNARLGRGDYMVVEADESDRSFLKLSPSIAVITNIDREHMESYGSWDEPAAGVCRLRQQGAVLRRGRRVRRRPQPSASCCRRLTRRVITYGLDDAGRERRRRSGMRLEAFGSRCDVVHRRNRDAAPTSARRAAPARARAAQPAERARRRRGRARSSACRSSGSPRRSRSSAAPSAAFRCAARSDGVMVVDDYGHHPTEIAAVIAAARAGIDRRVVVVFQPHRYSRTSQLMEEFGTALARRRRDRADRHLCGRRGRRSRASRSTRSLTRSAPRHAVRVHVVTSCSTISRPRSRNSHGAGDLVITLGAGSIGRVGDRILEALPQRGSRPSAGPETKADEREGRHRKELPAREVKPANGARGTARISWRVVRIVVIGSRWSATRSTARSIWSSRASTLQVRHIAVTGNVRLSEGEVRTLVEGCAARAS